MTTTRLLTPSPLRPQAATGALVPGATGRLQGLRQPLVLGVALLALAGCATDGSFDPDLRHYGKAGLDTSAAARQATANRPSPDSRGVISYPNYQVAVAQRGDTVASLAARVGLDAGALARYNAVEVSAPLNQGEIIALPSRVAESTGGTGMIGGGERVDITTLASGALDRAAAGGSSIGGGAISATTLPAPAASAPVSAPATAVSAPKPAGPEPIRHKVARGETAFSIARYYDVNVKSLAEWNGLGSDLSVREGQYLLVPVTAQSAPPSGSSLPAPAPAVVEAPAAPAPAAPAAAAPAAPAAAAPAAPAASTSRMQMPVQGAIIRPYVKKKNDGIDIAAAPGTAVQAAADGTVAAITKDTEQVPILVLRHDNGLLTVYANLDGITVAKGASVKRGQTIAKVRAGDPGFLHFEVRDGFESVDPTPYVK